MIAHGRATVLLAALCAAVLCSGTAYAAFPGANGQIVYQVPGAFPNGNLRTISPDGTGDRAIGPGSGPAWSPDGERIAYGHSGEVYVARADGSQAQVVASGASPTWSPDGAKLAYLRGGDIFVTDVFAGGETNLTNSPSSKTDPAWSPDGTKIAFAQDVFSGSTDGDVWVVDVNTANLTNLTDAFSVDDTSPNWSPDGARIVYVRGLQGNTDEIAVMNADGTGHMDLTSNSVSDASPAWSPDGTKIVFSRGATGGLFVMNPDGSSPVQITPPGQASFAPDWQPVGFVGYPRPKGASPVRTPLVPAYNSCFAPNETHGPPLAFASCNPPAQQSTTLTVGTPDANGAAANSVGSARLASIAGDPDTPADEADVKVDVNVTDVRCAASNAACPGGAVSAFSGSVLLAVNLRITDKLNGSPGPGTTQDRPLRSPVTCAPTGNPAIGSTCTLSTTVDAISPGAVPEGSRSIWQLADVQVWDPGPNGTGYAACPPTCGNGDEAVFMRQGVFIP